MNQNPAAIRKVIRVAAEYTGAGLLCVALLVWLLELWSADLSIPYSWHGDCLFFPMCVKSMTESGWYLHNDRLGAPFALDLHDFPMAEGWHFLLLRGIVTVFPDPIVALNVYFLLTFPLAALIALFVFRHFGCSYPVGLAGALLFTFLPYHLLRGQIHLLLSAYYLVPLMIMVVLWLWRDPSFMFVERHGRYRLRWLGGKTVAAVVICALMGSAGIYYAYFGCFFLLLAALTGALARKPCSWRAAGILVGVVVIVGLANIAPGFWYAWEHGANPEAARRNMGEAEHFGMRIAQLLMPVTGHRIAFVAWMKSRFSNKLAMVTENDMASLGLLGSFGFLLLIGRLLVRRGDQQNSLLDQLSLLNVFGVLLATIGGFGFLFASALPQIRSYNRMSVFIGFFSLLALAVWLDSYYRRWATTPKRQWLCLSLFALFVVGGVLDQTPAAWCEPQEKRRQEYESEMAFIQQIEAITPEGAMIYQLPYRVFPEGGSYEHLCGYLHSKKLRWSYPTMRGRTGDYWNRTLVDKPAEELAATLAFAGFQGIFIDRSSTDAPPADLESRLEKALGVKPLVSADKRFTFFDMGSYITALHDRFPGTEWEKRRDEALYPVLVGWNKGFSKELDVSAQNGRWCAASGQMDIFNPSSETRQATIVMTLRTGFPERAHLRITSKLLTKELEVTSEGLSVQETIAVPPGRHVLRFACDARAFQDNPRRVFQIVRFETKTHDHK